MLRATKKLITRFFIHMKKARNRRKLVIIVALIGVYYLGKHSSSLNTGSSQGEKRYLRGRFRDGGVVLKTPKRVDNKIYVYFRDLLFDPARTQQTDKADDTNTPPPAQSSVRQTSTGSQVDKKHFVQADKPKRTSTTKLTQAVSYEGSTIRSIKTSTNTTPTKHSKNMNTDGDLLNDKKFFEFIINKSDTKDQSKYGEVLRTLSYAELLQNQISRRTLTKTSGLTSQNVNDLLSIYGYSKATSDKLPLLRNVPDNRDSRCKDVEYGISKLDISVITVVQYGDAVSVILRMLISVLHRTPRQVLREIILVNDAAVWNEKESNLLHSFVTKLTNVKVITHNTSLGLAKCMNSAAKMATGQVLAFLSPKIEVTNDWHISLLAWLAENPIDMVLPVIDPVHWKTLEYSKSKIPIQIRGGFTWGLAFRWKAIPDEEKLRRKQNYPIELRTPVYNGAIILMNRHRYNTLLGANEAIEGNDNAGIATELSIKQWMCEGMIVTIPCSRVGFVYALENPLLSNQLIRNRVVIAESLMDDYKRYFYNVHFLTNESTATVIEKIDADIKTTKTMRQKLNCNSFEWYMYNIYYDKKEPRVDTQYGGLIRGAGSCVDASSYTIGRPVACNVCNNKSLTQQFELDISGTLIFDEDFILGLRKSKPLSGSPIEVLKRRTMFKTQEWDYDPKTTHLVHTASGLCMTCLKGMLLLMTCDKENRETQGWNFDWKRPS